MRHTFSLPCQFVLACFVALLIAPVGCSKSTEPVGPEMGSVQQFLENNPEALEDEPVVGEDVEFDAADVE